jgi:hypothetical protein
MFKRWGLMGGSQSVGYAIEGNCTSPVPSSSSLILAMR